nr:MAG TPA: 30S ribosomal protein S27 [Caudoviricetes sp.]DAN79013.1 MAG TPA: 30S ribosomal protein S27 [Caudoviricetes sp.]DAP27934.1 MAG TPA: 30S ribosomal protein S27 [Caudoviricetes sp.]DAX97166.1 MAG TPA: 30S ribosomal protein S27 [Caudoviricetes sp.]
MCLKCGCNVQAKTRLKMSSCPEGKWHYIEVKPIET